jgi:hypothetical protein
MYNLDRTAFKIQTFEEADHTLQYWLTQSYKERLTAGWYLSCVAFNVDPETIRMDRTVFSMRKHSSK